MTSSYLCEESQGVVSTLGSHLSDQVLGAVLQQLLFNGVPTLQPEQHTKCNQKWHLSPSLSMLRTCKFYQWSVKEHKNKELKQISLDNVTCICVYPWNVLFCHTTPGCGRPCWDWGLCHRRWWCLHQTKAQLQSSSGWSGCCRTPSCSC